MDDLRKSPQFVKIHNWCEFLKCWNKIPKRCLLLSLTWRIFYNSEQIFYWEKYFLLSQKWSKEEYLCVHRVSSPFNWNLKLTFIEFTVATKRCFLTQKNSVVSHLSYPTTWEIDSQSWRLSQMFYTFRKKEMNSLIHYQQYTFVNTKNTYQYLFFLYNFFILSTKSCSPVCLLYKNTTPSLLPLTISIVKIMKIVKLKIC